MSAEVSELLRQARRAVAILEWATRPPEVRGRDGPAMVAALAALPAAPAIAAMTPATDPEDETTEVRRAPLRLLSMEE